MKGRIYLRVAESGRSGQRFVVQASGSPHYGALLDSHGDPRPTAAFALELDIPESLFRQAEQVMATIELPEEQAEIVALVTPHEAA